MITLYADEITTEVAHYGQNKMLGYCFYTCNIKCKHLLVKSLPMHNIGIHRITLSAKWPTLSCAVMPHSRQDSQAMNKSVSWKVYCVHSFGTCLCKLASKQDY